MRVFSLQDPCLWYFTAVVWVAFKFVWWSLLALWRTKLQKAGRKGAELYKLKIILLYFGADECLQDQLLNFCGGKTTVVKDDYLAPAFFWGFTKSAFILTLPFFLQCFFSVSRGGEKYSWVVNCGYFLYQNFCYSSLFFSCWTFRLRETNFSMRTTSSKMLWFLNHAKNTRGLIEKRWWLNVNHCVSTGFFQKLCSLKNLYLKM